MTSKRLGQIADPWTGDPVDVYAEFKRPASNYKTWRGERETMPASDPDAWPGLCELHLVGTSPQSSEWKTESGWAAIFSELHIDDEGWWQNPDLTYMPHMKRSIVAQFFIQLGEGLSNGYPTLDVLVFALNMTRLNILDRLGLPSRRHV